MPNEEVYANPTVTQVIFQIRFPNLFNIASRIGDLQIKIMNRFPESKLLQSRSILIADLGPDAKLGDIPEPPETPGVQTIWQFLSPEGVKLDITTSSLSLVSTQHKTYSAPGATPRFREAIEFTVTRFLDVLQLPLLTRIGLRYIDHCPLPPSLTNAAFLDYYLTTFPLNRFPISDAIEMSFVTRIRRGEHFLRFSESLNTKSQPPKYILDFDGYAENTKSDTFLSTTDSLHELIHTEYETFIKDPVRTHMREPEA